MPLSHDLPRPDVWGRVPGLAPPVPVWLPLALFALLGAGLAAVVLVLVRPPGPLDQPDLAYQRDGLLRTGPVVPAELGGLALGGQTVVLVFARTAPPAEQLGRWRSELAPERQVRLVLPLPSRRDGLGVPVVVDPAGDVARAVALPVPVDGGPGVGYAVVDADRVVRYATLDPAWLDNAFEVATIAGAVS